MAKVVRAVRGAVSIEENSAGAILQGTGRLLSELARINHLRPEDIISAIFTATPDLNAAFPAAAARQLGWTGVPLLDAVEMAVPGSLPRVVRVLLHCLVEEGAGPLQPVYLGEAASLRPDLEFFG
ncbi:MAG: chorismate mutase [Clostridia bacterium]|nr:chorismate mutase [Clostridia bacterium]